MKKTAFLSIKLVITLLACVLVGILAMTLIYCLPTAPMRKNLSESLPLLEYEGKYFEISEKFTSTLDNWTDAVMLHNAVYGPTENLIVEAMLVNRITYDEKDTVECLIADFEGQEGGWVKHYARYWHGYLLTVKPLLLVLNYSEIRILNHFCQLALIAFAVIMLKKKGYSRYIIPFLLLMGLQGLTVTGNSLQNSTIFYTYIIAFIILLEKYEKWQGTDKLYLFFAGIGIVTSFIDFLTYPLVSFGVPMVLCMVMTKETSFKKQFKQFFLSGFCWGFGYAGMWAGKCVAATLITNENIIKNAIEQVFIRSSETTSLGHTFTTKGIAIDNFKFFANHPAFILAIVFCAYIVFVIIKKKNVKAVISNIVMIIICLLPVVWFAVLKNHSGLHAWLFTYREYLISAFGGMCLLVKMSEGYNPKSVFMKSVK